MLRWFEETGSNDDVVISSRIRLARNITEFPFSTRITSEQTEEMLHYVNDKISGLKELEGYKSYNMNLLDKLDKEALKERNVISGYLFNQSEAGLFVSVDEKNTVMLNEEDHIRIQSIASGMNIEDAYKRANIIDDAIGKVVNYAYDDNFGYLTTCPSNVGTGMKASYVLHLPALGNSKMIQELIGEVGHFGITMKGMYGEDGSGCGHIYKISNQKTLGQSEKEIINNLNNVCKEIMTQEREARKRILKIDRLKLEDEVYKSYGVLKYSRKLKYKDAMLFLSELRLGLAMGLMSFEERTDFIVYQLMIGIQSANLRLIAGRNLSEEELEEIRAGFIRENLPIIN